LDKEELKRIWNDFIQDKDFTLNPEPKLLEALADGVLKNKEKFGYGFCPCRLRDGTKEQDIALLCPCNFKTQPNWNEKGRCWCGLFVKRE